MVYSKYAKSVLNNIILTVDLLKGGKAEQFPLDEVLNEDERLVRGFASVEIKDSQGEIIPIKGMKGLKRSMNTWMDRGGIITDTHTNRVVGKGLRWFETKHPKSKEDAIAIDYKIHRDYSIDDEVWEDIKSGKRKGLSFGGRALDEPTVKRDKHGDGAVRELTNIEAYEMASVEEPANKLAENTMINFLAKSNVKKEKEKENVVMSKEDFEKAREFGNKLLDDMQKGYAVKDIKKPFGGFNDFKDCTLAQEERGHTVDSAERICGWLQNRTEDKSKESINKGPDKLLAAFKKRLDEKTFNAVNEVFEESYAEAYPEGMKKKEEPNTESDDESKITYSKSIEKKLDIISKIFKFRKDKKKTAFKIINLPDNAGKVVEAEFPDGERQFVVLQKDKPSDEEVEQAIINAVRTFNSSAKSNINKFNILTKYNFKSKSLNRSKVMKSLKALRGVSK